MPLASNDVGGFFYLMRYDIICLKCGHTQEIKKTMTAGYPTCEKCGGATQRNWNETPAVIYNAADFYHTDYKRFESQVGTERAARFRAQKENVERRSAAGKLTAYEKSVEAA